MVELDEARGLRHEDHVRQRCAMHRYENVHLPQLDPSTPYQCNAAESRTRIQSKALRRIRWRHAESGERLDPKPMGLMGACGRSRPVESTWWKRDGLRCGRQARTHVTDHARLVVEHRPPLELSG